MTSLFEFKRMTILIGFILALALGIMIPFVTAGQWIRSPIEPGIIGWLCLMCNAVLVLTPWLMRLGNRLDYFEPILLVSLLFFFVFVLRPLQILIKPEMASRFLILDRNLLDRALLMSALGFASFQLGYTIRLGNNLGASLPEFWRIGGSWKAKRVVFISLFFIAIGLISVALAVSRSGGIRAFAGNLQGRLIFAQALQSFLAAGVVLITVPTIISFAFYFKNGRLKYFAVLILLLAVGLNLSFGGRSAVLIPVLAVIALYHYVRGGIYSRLTKKAGVLILVIVLIVIFVVTMGDLRAYTARGGNLSNVNIQNVLFSDSVVQSFVAEYAQFDWFAIVLEVFPERIPYQLGRSFADAALMFVPRPLWPEKPIPVAFTVNSIVGGPGSGTPSSILGEFYLNFGIFGIVAGAFLSGIILKTLYQYTLQHLNNLGIIVIYTYTFASLQRFFTRSFAPKILGFSLFLLPALLAMIYVSWGTVKLTRMNNNRR